ncbi:unnamed protein product [Gordionus sp. m RMFG-2023]
MDLLAIGTVSASSSASSVVEVNRISDRLMKIKLCIGQSILHILSVYAPQTGCKEEEKDDFRAILDEAVMEIPKDDLVIIGGDLNAHVGATKGIMVVLDTEKEMMKESTY